MQGQKKFDGARLSWNFSGKYKLTRNYGLFADFINFTRTNGLKYRGSIDPVHRAETNILGVTLTAGIQGKF